MDPISQQLSNAGSAKVRRTPADNEGLLPPNEHISYVSHLDFLFYPLNFFSYQLAVAAEHLLSQWVEGKQRRKIHNQSELFSSQRLTLYSNLATVSNHKVQLDLATEQGEARGDVLGHTATTVS